MAKNPSMPLLLVAFVPCWGLRGISLQLEAGLGLRFYLCAGSPPFSFCCLALPHPVKCPPAGLYGSPFAARPSYTQAHVAVHSTQELHPKHYPKPIYSYR